MKRSTPDNMKESVCLLCAKFVLPDEQHLTKRNIFEYPDWMNFVVEVIGFELCHDESLPDIVCNLCIEQLNQYFAYRREIFNNVMKHHINYYNLKNDLTKVEFYQAKIRQNRFENYCKIDPSGQNSPKRIDDHLIITDVRSERVSDLDHQSYLLEPMFQMSENVLETESGGIIHTINEEITARQCAEMNQEFRCEFCEKVYNKPHYYRKHMRKHIHKKARKNKEKRRFLCHEMNCGKLFNRLIELRKHMTIHESKFKCPCCYAQFPLWYDYEWHYQVCDATQRGRCEGGNDRRTRSKGRLSKSVISELSDCSLSQVEDANVSCAKKRDYSFYDGCPNVSNNPQVIEHALSAESESEASIVSTMSDYGDAERLAKLETHKIRRKHRQEKRRAERLGKKYFACSLHKTCEFGSNSLAVTMNHETSKHKMLRLYNCSMCKAWFNSKKNLIIHRQAHDSEEICVNCDMKFDSKYDLEHHISLHHKKSYDCYFCSRSYLQQSQLSQHLKQKHPNDSKKVTHGIIYRLDSEGKNESVVKRPVVSYISKELIQRGTCTAGQRNVAHGYKKEIVNFHINPCHEQYMKYEYNYSKPQPFTLSVHEDIDSLQVPIDFYFDRPPSPIVFYKEEHISHVAAIGSYSSRSLSPISTLDKFNMFLTENYGNATNCSGSFDEPLAKRLRPDSTISYIPSFEDLFPRNHIYYDRIRGISSKWS